MLPRDEQIVLIESKPPIKSKKIFYYKDSFFTKRLIPPVEIPTQEPFDPNKFSANAGTQENQNENSDAEAEAEAESDPAAAEEN